MGSLKHAVPRFGRLLSVLGLIAVSGRVGVCLAFGLLAVVVALIGVVALAGTFGAHDTREAAQTVLAILFGRDRPGS